MATGEKYSQREYWARRYRAEQGVEYDWSVPGRGGGGGGGGVKELVRLGGWVVPSPPLQHLISHHPSHITHQYINTSHITH